MRFMKSHKCYDIVPTSSKLVVFDTTLQVRALTLEMYDLQNAHSTKLGYKVGFSRKWIRICNFIIIISGLLRNLCYVILLIAYLI